MSRRMIMAVVLILMALGMQSVMAAVPTLINFQGLLTDSTGTPLDTTVTMYFIVHDYPDLLDSLWGETHPNVSVVGGVFNVVLGSQGSVPPPVRDSTRWLGIRVGNDPEMTPRIRLTSVPAAFGVATVSGAGGGPIMSPLMVHGWLTVDQFLTVGGEYALIGTGHNVSVLTSGFVAGNHHTIGSGINDMTIGGGDSNSIYGIGATVSGGEHNAAIGNWSSVGGGRGNYADDGIGDGAIGATVGGGINNGAFTDYCTVAGGYDNQVSESGAAIAGGMNNRATGGNSFVGGGWFNYALGYGSVVSGGQHDTTRGQYAVVPGGRQNVARADYSFAAGYRAQANHVGSFVWADTGSAYFVSTAENQFLINATGGVGIGTNAPSEALHVVGNVCATGGHITCSDARYKTNVGDMRNALEIVSQMRGVEFEWKRRVYPDFDFPEGRQFGFIAQELAEVLPSVVSQGTGGYYSVDYARVTPVLVEAIKALKSQTEKQAQEINSLRAQVDQLQVMTQKVLAKIAEAEGLAVLSATE